MEFFKQHFHDVEFGEHGEVKVRCPFHNDTEPSAQINVDKGLFHCWVCGIGYDEKKFMSEVKGIPITQAVKLLSEMSNHVDTDWDIAFKAELWANDEVLKAVHDLGFTNDTIEETRLGLAYLNEGVTLAFPIFFDGVLMDIRRYNILKLPNTSKMTSDKGAKSGWIFPYDSWKTSSDTTYIFEGEKDALMARQLGLNAISLTGGAQAKPNEFCLPTFKDKDVIICYDNDEAGREGMAKLAQVLSPVAKSVGTIDISAVVKEDKEDFFDYIHKYDGDIFEFMSLTVTPYVPENVTQEYTKIKQAMEGNFLRKKLNSHVTVTSEFVEAYSVPTFVQAEKVFQVGDKDTMDIGDKRYWELTDENMNEILSLIEVDAKDKNIDTKINELLKLPEKEKGIKVEKTKEKFIYRCIVTDKDVDGSAMAVDLYSFDKLMVGGQYDIEYQLFAHPNKHQRIVAIATYTIHQDDQSNFVVDKNILKQFKTEGDVDTRVQKLYESAKHHVAKHMDFNIWLMSDLVFSSILDFKYGEVMRGALDVFMLGDTQVGKSETTSKLVDLYNFGHFLSLKTSTTVGLIGGSNKVDGSWANTIGAIPRQHKKLAVLEEFSGARADFIKTMTDIRSSNEVRLTRASGELKAPCKLRMITISNPINDANGNPRFLSSFPNGVIPVMELVKSAEDVARYDGFILTPKKKGRFNPFENALVGEPIPKEAYEHKAQWVATRQVEDVWFEKDVESYIWQQAEVLNEKYECNVPIFGTTTSKKLARFCVAMASLIVNTDETFTKVVVTKEIVNYIVTFLDANYSSPQFKLDKVKEEWDSYSKYDEKDVKIMESLYPANTVLIEFMSNHSRSSRANLQAISGKDRDAFGTVFNQLVQYRMVKIDMENVYPTNKFRDVYAIMNKTTGQMVTKYTDTNNDLD